MSTQPQRSPDIELRYPESSKNSPLASSSVFRNNGLPADSPTASHLAIHPGGNPGAEPGIDPHRDSSWRYKIIHEKCHIQVTEYGNDPGDYRTHTFDNDGLLHYLQHTPDPSEYSSEGDLPAQVKWINVGGISWDVLSALALKYDFHSLALEDILSPQDRNNSKPEYFQKHLFLRILCHTLCPKGHDCKAAGDTAQGHSGDIEGAKEPPSKISPLLRSSTLSRRVMRQRRQMVIERLKGDTVQIKSTTMYIFLLRGGDTVISIRPITNLDFFLPIMKRLQDPTTGLRTSIDASLLVQSLLDLTVDIVLEIVEEYENEITELEHNILFKPTMNTTRRLHILSGALNHLRGTLEPVRTMIYALRRYDSERTIASSFGYDMAKGRRSREALQLSAPSTEVEGYMSFRAKIYLSDVYDHIDFAIQNIDRFAGVTENLINFAFNMASYEMNEQMRRLTLATIIFLPLTLLTGYFGMNFEHMASVHEHSDLLFWIIALPAMGLLVPIFIWPDLVKMIIYIRKKVVMRRWSNPNDA